MCTRISVHWTLCTLYNGSAWPHDAAFHSITSALLAIQSNNIISHVKANLLNSKLLLVWLLAQTRHDTLYTQSHIQSGQYIHCVRYLVSYFIFFILFFYLFRLLLSVVVHKILLPLIRLSQLHAVVFFLLSQVFSNSGPRSAWLRSPNGKWKDWSDAKNFYPKYIEMSHSNFSTFLFSLLLLFLFDIDAINRDSG